MQTVLYVPACIGRLPHGNNRNAMNRRPADPHDPRHPEHGRRNRNVRGSDLTNGIHQAGQGIFQYGYTWPALAFAPREARQ